MHLTVHLLVNLHHKDHEQGGTTHTTVNVGRIRQQLRLVQDKQGRSYQTPVPKLEVFPQIW